MNYLDQMYPPQEAGMYPRQLCKHLIENFIPSTLEISFLEIGCARGEHLRIFHELLSQETTVGKFCGVDMFSQQSSNDIQIDKCNIENDKLPYLDDSFDVVFSKSVIEHVQNIENFLEEAYRVLKPGGTLVIMTPDWQTQMKNFYDDPTHVKPFTKRSMYAALQLHKFQDVTSKTFMQLPSTWKSPVLRFIFEAIGRFIPECFKWKTATERNTKDRKWIRFSKELMILATGKK